MVILAFIGNDAARTMSVYRFLTFPDGGMPFTKPQFVTQDGELQIIKNVHLGSREDQRRSVPEIPAGGH